MTTPRSPAQPITMVCDHGGRLARRRVSGGTRNARAAATQSSRSDDHPDQHGHAEHGDPAARQVGVDHRRDDPPGLQPDQQEDGVLQQELDRRPVDPFAQPGLAGLDHRRLVAEDQPGDDDRDHARAVEVVGSRSPRPAGRPRTARSARSRCRRPAGGCAGGSGSGDEGHRPAPPRPRRRRRSGSRRLTSPAVTAPPIAAIATRRQVMAVASLTSDSPSKMVTSRRGRPTRRAIEVAATASGGATTAPRAKATAKLHRQDQPGDQTDAQRGDHDQHRPTAKAIERRVGAEVDHRGADGGGVQQRRQEAEQHDLGR